MRNFGNGKALNIIPVDYKIKTTCNFGYHLALMYICCTIHGFGCELVNCTDSPLWRGVFLSFIHPYIASIFASMKQVAEIGLYEAIALMRRLSSEEKPFVLAHFTYDRHRLTAHGLSVVQRAILRPAASTAEVTDANFKIFYTNLDDRSNRNCWQPLLAYVNGMRVKINGYDQNSQQHGI